MNPQRRTFLGVTLSGGACAVAVAAGLLSPRSVLAGGWPAGAFEAAQVGDALEALLGANAISDSDRITVKAPDIAENGAVVSITVETDLPEVESISLLARDNTSPLTATFMLGAADPFVNTRIKMRKTSDVIAVVKSQGKLYSASKPVKVTLGGCGG